jgi:hypothetical protein
VYNHVELLSQHRSEVVKDPETKEYHRLYGIIDPALQSADLHRKERAPFGARSFVEKHCFSTRGISACGPRKVRFREVNSRNP